jgi:thiol-disulfide isomerase/thioredoxin
LVPYHIQNLSSKKLAPKLEKAAQQLQEQNIVVAKVDANEEKVLAARLKVRGFPTLFFYRGGLRQLYTGGRTTEAIVEWVTANAKPLLNIFETEYDVPNS